MTVHLVRRFPDHATGSDWRDSRWTDPGAGIITVAGLLGVNGVGSVRTELVLGLGAVVFGAGYAGYVTGSMAELERAGSNGAAERRSGRATKRSNRV